MREIKFRAWDKPNKKMFRVLSLDFHFGTVMCTDSWYEGQVSPCVKIKLCECELMQYTELKDKFGFGVYEGDILEVIGEANSKVYFSQGSFMAEEINGWDPLVKYYPLSGNIEHSEVIGNIYENPELLEVK